MRTLSAPLLAAALFFATPCAALAETVTLPAPDTAGGLPLMQALAQRKTIRSLSKDPLDQATLGNLLWAAWGRNRPDGRRTAPSARNRQALKLYVNKADGLWLYDAAGHRLERIAAAPLGSPLDDAAVVLIYAVPEEDPYGGMHIGSVYQNVGLFCASAGLGNVVKASTTRDASRFAFLPDGWRALATQSVGKPR